MTRLIAALFAVVLVCVACTKYTTPLSLAQKEQLRKFIAPTFDSASIPKGREEDFYRILDAFAATRAPDEFVRGILFVSDTEAHISYSGSPNIHGGGGSATVRKIDGRWTIGLKVPVV